MSKGVALIKNNMRNHILEREREREKMGKNIIHHQIDFTEATDKRIDTSSFSVFFSALDPFLLLCPWT